MPINGSRPETVAEIQYYAEQRLKIAIEMAPRPKIQIPTRLSLAKPGTKSGSKDPRVAAIFVKKEMEDWIKRIAARVREEIRREYPEVELNYKISGELSNPGSVMQLSALAKMAGQVEAEKLENSSTRFEVMVVAKKGGDNLPGYLVGSVEDAYKIYKSKGGVLEWDEFLRIIQRRNPNANTFESINDPGKVREGWILSIPLEPEEDKRIIQIIREHTKNRKKEIDHFVSLIEKNSMIYTVDYGWMDLGHAGFRDSPTTPQYVAQLLKDISNSKPGEKVAFEMGSGATVIYKKIRFSIRGPEIVVNAQILKHIPDEPVAKGIALSIFKTASVWMEERQGTGLPGLTRGKASTFSEEDLPSNVLSFLKQTENLDKATAMRAARAFSKDESKWIASVYEFRKNVDFSPITVFPGAKLPSEFKTVPEVKPGEYWKIISIELKQIGFGK
jgi:hypothetical protein